MQTLVIVLKAGWFWKGLMGLAVFSFAVGNTIAGRADPYYTDGIRASLYALSAAVLLFTSIIPENSEDDRVARVVESTVRLLSALIALGAGWYWFSAEAGANRGDYIVQVIVVASALLVLSNCSSRYHL